MSDYEYAKEAYDVALNQFENATQEYIDETILMLVVAELRLGRVIKNLRRT